MVFAGCAAGSTETLTSLQESIVEVDGESLRVLVADTSVLRNQGFQNVDVMPAGIDGILFEWETPRTTTFHMRNVEFPLKAWWFDEDGHLLGSVEMAPCTGDECVSYGSPGEVLWALETAIDEWDFSPGSNLSFAG